MSTVVKFFVATNESAVDALAFGPDSSSRGLFFGNFDAEEALLDWESHLTGVSFGSLLAAGFPEVVAEDGEGASVLLLSERLVDSLAAASDSEVSELARWWVGEKAVDGTKVELPVASVILRSLVDLTREEREPRTRVYCWVG
ncbi:hypothetical protein [Saccharomonospora cyanea]|uniref:hypothetical protein n=1 Tax=Saccharomonospora cyanea TaxID=40989 RepID=UPI0012F89B32|nr:hypothetical protein [Saccharomonospora cyanea]